MRSLWGVGWMECWDVVGSDHYYNIYDLFAFWGSMGKMGMVDWLDDNCSIGVLFYGYSCLCVLFWLTLLAK